MHLKTAVKVTLAIVLCIALCAPAAAIYTSSQTVDLPSRTVINDPDTLTRTEVPSIAYSRSGIRTGTAEPYYHESLDTYSDALREMMVNREGTVTLGFKCYSEITQDFHDDVEDLVFAHTGNGKEGDYLEFTFAGYNVSGGGYIKGGVYYYTLVYTIGYYTSAEMESELDAAVDALLPSLKKENDYDTVKAIYDYMCENIAYDYDNLNDEGYTLKYSAYAALINKTSVCQGYANLFYRLALDCGVDARIIAGTGGGGAHSWNIVKLDGYYYNLDATWDSARAQSPFDLSYKYFLKCDRNFFFHFPSDIYKTEEFTSAYPKYAMDYSAKNPAHRHEYSSEWSVDVYATADTPGEKSRYCECGARTDVTPLPYVSAATVFNNYQVHNWSSASIDFVSSNGLMGSAGGNDFMQTGTMTRAMFVTVLWRIAGRPDSDQTGRFSDLDPTQKWYHKAVAWSSENGIVNGTGANTFSPNECVTRQQIATILYRYVTKYLGEDASGQSGDITSFPDYASVQNYALEALAWANGAGLVKGTKVSDEVFLLDPMANATREQVAVIITRFLTE